MYTDAHADTKTDGSLRRCRWKIGGKCVDDVICLVYDLAKIRNKSEVLRVQAILVSSKWSREGVVNRDKQMMEYSLKKGKE